MKKIPSLYLREDAPQGRQSLVTDRRNPAVHESVWRGLARATRKWDGTAVLVGANEVVFKRYDAKRGKVPPEGFIPAQDPDPLTGHWPGWVRLSEDKPEDKWIREAVQHYSERRPMFAGTYEAIGPKINSNHEGYTEHTLKRHGDTALNMPYPITFEGLRRFFKFRVIEGAVWWFDGAPVAKIKRRDFGLPWPETKEEVQG